MQVPGYLNINMAFVWVCEKYNKYEKKKQHSLLVFYWFVFVVCTFLQTSLGVIGE